LLWLRLRGAWVLLTGTGAAASVAFGLLVFVSVLASLAIPRASVGLRGEALRQVIAASRPSNRTVIGTANEMSIVDGNGLVQSIDLAAAGASLRTKLTEDGVPIATEPPAWASLITSFVRATGPVQVARHGPPQFELTYRTALAHYSQIVAGRLPAGGLISGKRIVVQAAVTTDTAARFGLRVGSRFEAGPMQMVITGIIRPGNSASAFWRQDPVADRPALTPAAAPALPYWIGAVFVGSGALPMIESALGSSEMEVSWAYAVAFGRLGTGQASGLDSSVRNLVAAGATFTNTYLGDGQPVTVPISSQIPAILSPFVAGERAAAPVLELLYVSLAVLGAIVVLLGARLVAQRRTAEFTLMRARGAALYQLGWLVLRASVIIAVVAGAAAAALALGLTRGDGSGNGVGWWLAGLSIAVTLIGPVLISVVPQRVASPATGRPVRAVAGPRMGTRRIVAEAALVAMAIGGLIVLRDQGVTTGNNGLYTSAAPVLIAIPVAVLVLRCYPPLARQLARIAGLSRGVVAFVGLTRATRTPPGTVLPSFALVLVLAMVAFPDMIITSVARSQAAASWQQVGADAIITAPSGQVITSALQRQIASVPGVSSTAIALAEAGTTGGGFGVTAVFVDPARYAAVVDQAPARPFPADALAAPGGGGPAAAAFPALATATAGQVVGKLPSDLDVGGSEVRIRPVGRIGAVPGVGAARDAVVMMPLEALGPRPPAPDLMLVAGPRLDAVRLSAVVRRSLPGAAVSFRASVLDALTTAPVLLAAQAALTLGLATAAGFGGLVLLLSLLLTARTRDMTLARLATMGLRRWQAQLLLATETLPPVVAAAVGGVLCAWLLAPLIGPSLDLAALSGTGSSILVTPAAPPLAAAALGLVLAALLVLAAQAVITYHRGSTRALRIAD
jgi:putative ABC transport system permease protein